MGGVALIELLKDVCSNLRTDAAPGVGVLDHSVSVFFMELQTDRAAILGELDSIGEEIVPYKAQQFRVTVHRDAVFDVRFDLKIFGLPGVFKRKQTFAELLPQIEMLLLGIEYVKEHFKVQRIDLGVFENNNNARYCYEAVGFREYSRRLCTMKIGTWECIDMELFL
jgi:hypothetical protein